MSGHGGAAEMQMWNESRHIPLVPCETEYQQELFLLSRETKTATGYEENFLGEGLTHS